jgi:hypothetical protein
MVCYERLYFLIARLVKDFAGSEFEAEDYFSGPKIREGKGQTLTHGPWYMGARL